MSVYQRLRALSALGHEVDLVTYHVGQNVELPNLRIHRIAAVPFVKEVPVGPSWIKPLLDILLLAAAFWLMLHRRFDVIHSHEEAAFIAVFLSFLFRTRHIYDMHSSLPRQFENFGFGNWPLLVGMFRLLERMVFNTCEAVITVGVDLEAVVRQINPRVPVVTIENIPLTAGDLRSEVAALEQLRQKLALQDKLSVIYTGTFEAYQGLDLLLESARIVVEANPKAHFVVVGGKAHQVSYWQDMAGRSGLADHMQFVGTVPIEESLLYLDLAEVLVSPRTGGTSVPLKIYSYLHAGKAVVATKLAAHTHVLTEQVALLVEPTREALAEGILTLLDDAQLRTRLGDQARLFAEEHYSFAAYVNKVQGIYEAQLQFSLGVANSTIVAE